MTNREQLMQELEQAPDELVQTVLDFLHQVQATRTPSPWPDAILSYQGVPDFPAFESYRDELLPLTEPELF